MQTKQLDIEAILREAEPTEPYTAAPEGLRIGHIHLRVGSVERPSSSIAARSAST